MVVSALLIAVLAGTSASDGPDPGALIGRLAAERFDDRVAAFKALEKLGAEALPALRAAADSPDPRIRSRVRALMESAVRQAATERITRPTLVRLDFHDRPLAEVVRALNDRHDFRLALQLAPDPPPGMSIFGEPDETERLARLRAELDARTITLVAAAPVPFWDAIDRLCKAAALHYQVSRPRGVGSSQGSLLLLADRTGRGPVFDSGPFRVQLTRDQPVFEREFGRFRAPTPPGRRVKPAGRDELTVPLAIIPEPGLVLHPNGPVTIDEAVDDWGRALIARPPKAPDTTPAHRHAFGENSPASIEVNVQLAAPTLPVTFIRRLRGKVPVIVVSKAADPLVIPLKGAGAVGKPYWTREMTLFVDEVSLAPMTQISVRVTRPADSAFQRSGSAADSSRPDFTSFDFERVMEHIELYDAAGRRLNHVLGGQTKGFAGSESFLSYPMIVVPGFEDGASIQSLREPGAPRTPVPTELRYYGFVQTEMQIPFEFRDIRMP